MSKSPNTKLQPFLAMLREGNYVILDTETTGLNDAEICQIGIVDGSGEVLIDTFVKPLTQIPSRATAIHGITNSMVKDAPSWAVVSEQVVPLLDGRDVIAYNAVFDRKMMHQSAQAWGLPKVDWKTFSRWWCAMEAFSELYGESNSYRRGGFKYQSLKTAAAHYRVPVERAHTALADCMTTLAVVRAMGTSL
jgi:DNA polymerase III subunit epsilon